MGRYMAMISPPRTMPEDYHDDRLEEGGEVGHHGIHVLFVKIGDLVEHGVEGARRFAHLDHLDGHGGEDAALLERIGDAPALADVRPRP